MTNLFLFKASSKGLRFPVTFTITPGSEQIRATAERDGLLKTFEVETTHFPSFFFVYGVSLW